MTRWIERLGIDQDKIIIAKEGDYFSADRLVLTTFPGNKRDMPPWVRSFWVDRIPTSKPETLSRIYIRRQGGIRSIENNEEVEQALKNIGFSIIDPSTIENPELLISQASVIVGAHGAGLTDCMFCKPGSWLIELVPSDHIYPYYYCMAGSSNLKYAYLVGKSKSHREKGTWGPSSADFSVDTHALIAGIESITDQTMHLNKSILEV
jgi:capsular polysaccharide biosynthesis protein